MRLRMSWCRTWPLLALLVCCAGVHAAERITLRNGFAVSCDRREVLGEGKVRLYLDGSANSYMDVAVSSIVSAEAEAALPLRAVVEPAAAVSRAVVTKPGAAPEASVDALIQAAGEARRLNVDLLRSVVRAESGGAVHAVSRAGAQGLMQLMPATAKSLGVADSFAPEQNLRGGTDYLDSLLRRYHDDLSLALAAYNAGPGAVDKYHGVPPYRETRLYVARIIREFNRRTLLAQRSAVGSSGAAAAR